MSHIETLRAALTDLSEHVVCSSRKETEKSLERARAALAATAEPEAEPAQSTEPAPAAQLTWPQKIWLQHGSEKDMPRYRECDNDDVTWCQDNIESADIPYVRADLTPPDLTAQLADMTKERDALTKDAALNMEGAQDFINALITGQSIWPNRWGQDVAAAAFFVHCLSSRHLHEELELELAASPTAVHGVPADWKLVPIEPTLAMTGEGDSVAEIHNEYGENVYLKNTEDVYRAMLAASPQPTGEQG